MLQAIKKYIEELVSDNVQTKPAVHIGFLPPKTKETAGESEFPFILVRPTVGEDKQDDSKVTVKLIFGVKAEDSQGFVDLFNLMEQLRISLQRQRIIEKRFRLELPYKWEFYDEQPYPEWLGEATTIWTLPTIQQEEGFL
ncbi:hypothetical protein [Paenibacillus sp. 22594]|uniref:hypothetical protein n=1 Tax=Paenibacillus sp. 22594 TaxID=3453947 RepID=UPI003F8485B2